jgi:hypothetical protein
MQREPVADVLSLLSDSVETVRALRWRNDHFPELGSPAYIAWANIRIPGRSVAYHAFEAASAQLGGAEDELLALHLVLEGGDLSVAPYILARAAIETCGRAYVLLDPDLSEDDRSALGLAEKLYELATLERLCQAQDDGDSLHEVLLDIRRRIGDLRRTAKRAAIPVPRRIGVTKAIEGVLRGADDDRSGTIAAATYSSFTHAVPRILMAHAWSLDPRMGHEWGVGFSDMGPKHTLHVAGNALIAYSNAIDRQVAAYGWPPSAWSRWKGHIRVAMRRSLKAFDDG